MLLLQAASILSTRNAVMVRSHCLQLLLNTGFRLCALMLLSKALQAGTCLCFTKCHCAIHSLVLVHIRPTTTVAS